ncbi:MAG: cupin domain-containing protein [Acidimicrobiia bacterium]|nr:cupin domain-containing protein [Acidimicrobiia bacterium]
MPAISKQAASRIENLLGIERRYQTMDGHTVTFEKYHRDIDMAPLFRGLPDDRCQSPHWGVLLSGRIVFSYRDEEETVTAGQAYYARPGHTARVASGTELIEFSPTAPLTEALEVSVRNMSAALSAPESLAASTEATGARAA